MRLPPRGPPQRRSPRSSWGGRRSRRSSGSRPPSPCGARRVTPSRIGSAKARIAGSATARCPSRRGPRGAAGGVPWPPRRHDPEPGVALRGRRLRPGRGPPPGRQRRLDDDAVAPPRRAGHRGVLGRRIGPDESPSQRSWPSPPASSRAAAIARLNDPASPRCAAARHASSSARQRLPEDREALGSHSCETAAVAGRQHVREHEPVLGQRRRS